MSTFIVKNNCVKCDNKIETPYCYGLCTECYHKTCENCGTTLKYFCSLNRKRCIECVSLQMCHDISGQNKDCDNNALVDDMKKALSNLKKKLI